MPNAGASAGVGVAGVGGAGVSGAPAGAGGGTTPGIGGTGAGVEPDAGSGAEPARAFDLSWHPRARRIAITDDSAAAHEQPRAWLVSHGDEALPDRLLTFRFSGYAGEWSDTGITQVDSGVSGVSLTIEDTHYQRVFFVSQGRLHVLRHDSGPHAMDGYLTTAAPPVDGFELIADDLAAVLHHIDATPTDAGAEGGVPIASVLVPAVHQGVPGHFCVLDFDILMDVWRSPHCSDAPALHVVTDLAGVNGPSGPEYFFRAPDGGLGRAAYDHALARYHVSRTAPPEGLPLAPSVAAVAAELPGLIELLVVSEDGQLYNARIAFAEPSASMVAQVNWQPLSIAEGVRASTDRLAVGLSVAERFTWPRVRNDAGVVTTDENAPLELYAATELRVLSEDGRVYGLATDTSTSDRPWAAFIEAAGGPLRGERVRALGGMLRLFVPFGAHHFEFAAGVLVASGERAATLQRSQTIFDHIAALDHVRIQPPVLHASTAAPAFAETSVAVGADVALLAAAVRGPMPPFAIELFDSIDGASSFERAVLPVRPFELAEDIEPSALEPHVALGAGLLHLVNLEWALPSHCLEPASYPSRIVYRRARSVEDLLALSPGDPDSFVVPLPGGVMQPALTVHEHADGATAHIAFRDAETGTPHLWSQASNTNQVQAPQALVLPGLPRGPLSLVHDVTGELFIAAAGEPGLRVCRVATGHCTEASVSALRPASPEMAFGPAVSDSVGHCAPIEGERFACFRDEQPFAIAASRVAPGRIVVVYAAEDPDLPLGDAGVADAAPTSLYIAVSPGVEGPGLRPFTAPHRIHQRMDHGDDAQRAYFDAEIALDVLDRMQITYSVFEPSRPGRPSTAIENRRAVIELDMRPNVSPIGGSPYRYLSEIIVGTYDPSTLAFSCLSGRWELGAYRDPDALNQRGLHVMRQTGGHATSWQSFGATP